MTYLCYTFSSSTLLNCKQKEALRNQLETAVRFNTINDYKLAIHHNSQVLSISIEDDMIGNGAFALGMLIMQTILLSK